MLFEFATATQIVFGDGTHRTLAERAAALGSRALLVTGSSPERSQFAVETLRAKGVSVALTSVVGEPTTETARRGLAAARRHDCDVVVAIGGGSVLDTGKAIAALLANGGDPLDYLEVIGAGKRITRSSAPYVAVPTTAGTGSEVTRNAVLASREHGVKVSLRSHHMLPRIALVDPQLTHTVPPEVTASTGLDALTQVLEPFVSRHANPLTDSLCREGLRRAGRSLRRAFEHGDDADARRDMAIVSLFGGLALANAKLGAVHGFAGPIGGMFPGPHGAVCAALLPAVVAANVAALTRCGADVARRFDEVARLVTGQVNARAQDGVAWLRETCGALGIPGLRAYGIAMDHAPAIVRKARAASSMKGNPVELGDEELHDILARSI